MFHHTFKKFSNLLKHLLRTDVEYLFRGAIYLSLGQAAISASGLLLTVGLARILEPADYGLYTYIFAIAGIASAFTLSGMDTAVVQAVSKGFNRTVIIGFQEKFKWSVPVGITTIGIGVYYLYQQNMTLGVSLCVIGIFTPIIYATSLYASYFNGRKEFGKIAADNSVKNISQTICMLIAAYFTHSVIWVVAAFFITNSLISTIRYTRLVQTLTISESETEQRNINLGKHLSVMDTLSVISTHIDKLLVFQLLGASALAIYALALAPVKQIQNLTKIIRTLILPKFGSRSINELKKMMQRKTVVFFVVSVIITIVYWLVAPFIFTYLFPKYQEAIWYTQILSLTLLTMPFILHTQALMSHHKTKELYILNIAKPVLKIGLLLSLVPSYGIWGAIYAFLVTTITISVSSYILFIRTS